MTDTTNKVKVGKKTAFQKAKGICRRAVLPVAAAAGCYAFYKTTGADLGGVALFGGYMALHSLFELFKFCKDESKKIELPYIGGVLVGATFAILAIARNCDDTKVHERKTRADALSEVLAGEKLGVVSRNVPDRLFAGQQKIESTARLVKSAFTKEGARLLFVEQDRELSVYEKAKAPNASSTWRKIAVGALTQ